MTDDRKNMSPEQRAKFEELLRSSRREASTVAAHADRLRAAMGQDTVPPMSDEQRAEAEREYQRAADLHRTVLEDIRQVEEMLKGAEGDGAGHE
ncbi:hypothetical protein ACIOHC_36215 [Streptomyces sp. NPDC088252]|uniref:hypothetical protein n=1 Tax=Streptomyces sp. NPDC088252 TaxID=3365845 RepID=UPI003823B0F3